MGREMRRVPLDFHWPLKQVWKGFLNPYFRKCPKCGGTGATPGSRWLDKWLGEFEEVVLDSNRKYDLDLLREPKRQLTELFSALSGVKIEDLRIGSLATYSIREKLLEIAGLPGWGRCTACDSTGIDAEVKAKYDAWTEEPPPEGEGWQLWETVSEGSPISPVFPTKETFIDYLVGQGYSREAATQFAEDGWAPSMVMTGGKMLKDIESCR